MFSMIISWVHLACKIALGERALCRFVYEYKNKVFAENISHKINIPFDTTERGECNVKFVI